MTVTLQRHASRRGPDNACVIAKRTGYCDGFDNLRVDKVSVAPCAASVDEARSHKVVNKLSYFWRHYVTLCGSIA
jgi:hypothetical protein